MNNPYTIYIHNPITRTITVKYLLFGVRDFISTGPHLEPLENGQYPQFIIDMDTALHTIGYIKLSIFADASGTIIQTDSNGNPIDTRLVKSTSYTFPYIDISGNTVDGTIVLTFDDGSTFTSVDIEVILEDWYMIYSVNTVPQLFI
jgi:hypothetical protein